MRPSASGVRLALLTAVPAAPFGTIRGRSSFATGFSVRLSCLTSQVQKLESVDCRERIVLSARSVSAM